MYVNISKSLLLSLSVEIVPNAKLCVVCNAESHFENSTDFEADGHETVIKFIQFQTIQNLSYFTWMISLCLWIIFKLIKESLKTQEQ